MNGKQGYQDHQRSRGSGPPGQGGITAVREALTSTAQATYFGPDGKIRKALLDDEAQTAARQLEDIATTQLRRFFGQVAAIKRRLDMDERKAITDGEIQAQLAFLKASTAYAAGRDPKNLPLVRFMVTHANTVATRGDFSAFHRHFETVVAFHKVYAKDNKENRND